MATNRTFTMLKPDALENGHAGNIIQMITDAGFAIKAADGTIRKSYAESKAKNAVHGSDSDENAQIEGEFHFSASEIF